MCVFYILCATKYKRRKFEKLNFVPFKDVALAEAKKGMVIKMNNIIEVKARNAIVIALAAEGNTSIKQHVDHVVYIPQTNRFLISLLAVIPLQLLAYYAALTRDCNVDMPRNLAKSVTVE